MTVRNNTQTTNNLVTNGVLSTTINCLGNSVLIGGGAEITQGSDNVVLRNSYPQAVGVGGSWYAQLKRVGNQPGGGNNGAAIRAWAICAGNP